MNDSFNHPERNLGAVTADDRRAEPRWPAEGFVNLILESPQQLVVSGRLLDISEHGMRVEHMYTALASGMVLHVEVNNQVRTARVIWNRINSEGIESGFYLL